MAVKTFNKESAKKLYNALRKIDKEKLSNSGLFVDDNYEIILLNGKLIDLLRENGYTSIDLTLLKYSYKTRKCYLILQEKQKRDNNKEDFTLKF